MGIALLASNSFEFRSGLLDVTNVSLKPILYFVLLAYLCVFAVTNGRACVLINPS